MTGDHGSRIRFEYPNGEDGGLVRMTDTETGVVAEGKDHDEAADRMAARIKELQELGVEKICDGAMLATGKAPAPAEGGAEVTAEGAPPTATIPWTIKKYDRNGPRSIIEIRTAHHRANLLVVLLRADGSGSTIIGAGSSSAVEISWDQITEGVDYLERLYA